MRRQLDFHKHSDGSREWVEPLWKRDCFVQVPKCGVSEGFASDLNACRKIWPFILQQWPLRRASLQFPVMLPSLALTFCFVWWGVFLIVFLQRELFHRAGSCLGITEAKEALKGCLPLARALQKPLSFTCTTATSHSADLIPKRSQRRSFPSLVLCRNHLLFGLGMIKTSH